jgi:hypothetical protein
MLIECEGCQVRGTGCRDCVVPALLESAGGDPADGVVDIDEDERRALHVLAEYDLVPPLRLVPLPARDLRRSVTGERAS